MSHRTRSACPRLERLAVGLLALAVLALGPRPLAAKLPAPVQRAVAAAKLPQNAVSLVVHAVDEKRPRASLNAGVARNPASAIKLVTTWTALDVLGPTYQWPTEVYALGRFKERGTQLDGDLAIKGYGDPFLVIEEYWKLIGELRRSGLRHITGDLVIDDSFLDVDDPPPGAFDNRPHRLYNVRPSALIVNFNLTEFVLNTRGGSVVVETFPPMPGLRITSKVKATKQRCSGSAPQVHMRVDEGGAVSFSGSLPRTCRDYVLARSVLAPHDYAYHLFKTLWQQWGGTIGGTVRRARVPTGTKPFLEWRSRPLAEVIRPLNKWSNNVMTRLLLYALGASKHPPPVSRQQGATVLRAHLAARGLDVSGLVIDNGSGLSRSVRVSAAMMTDMLRLAWNSPRMPEFVSSLSILGEDGTTRGRFTGEAEAGRMHLKTGRLKNAAAVAGYVHAASGRTFAVAIIANHARARGDAAKRIENALLAWTFRQQ